MSELPKIVIKAVVVASLTLVGGCVHSSAAPGGAPTPASERPAEKTIPRRSLAAGHGPLVQTGLASWYGSGHRTASGERFNPNGLTAAHRTYAFGTRLRIENTSNGRTVVVRVNDRGPFHGSRVIDLARGSARVIGLTGVSRVNITRVAEAGE